MLLWIRIVIVAALLGVALSAWWYPVTNLVVIESVAWGSDHEARYAPQQRSRFTLGGASGAFLEQVDRSRPFVPLSEYMRAQLGDDWFESTVDAGTVDLPVAGDGRIWLKPDNAPLSSITREWVPLVVRDGENVDFYRLRWLDPLQSSTRVPADQMFPYRNNVVVPMLFLASLTLLAWRLPATLAQGSNLGRSSRFGSAVAIFFAVLGITGLLIAQRAAPDTVYALTFLALFLALCGLIAAVVFGLQLAWLRRLMAGENLIAHWQLEADDWQAFIEQDYRFSRREKLSRLLIMALMILLVGGGFALFAPDPAAGGVVTLVMLALLVILALVALLLPTWTYRRLLRAIPAVWIGSDGVCLGNQAQRWAGFGARLESVQFNHRQDSLSHLSVEYSTIRTATGPFGLQSFRDHHTVVVPVSPGQESEAQEVVRKLSS